MDLGKRKKVIQVDEPIPAETYTMPKKKEATPEQSPAPVKRERETVGVPS